MLLFVCFSGRIKDVRFCNHLAPGVATTILDMLQRPFSPSAHSDNAYTDMEILK